MNCEQARTEIIAYLKGELEGEKARRLEEHLARCPNCRHELEGARRLLSWTDLASEQAIAGKVEEIIDNAIRSGASDIHLDPQRDGTLLVRYRVDGVMHEALTTDTLQRHGIITRIKMLSDINVSEASLPQDGRFKWQVGDRNLDLRVTSCPSIYGEVVVIRILDQTSVMIGLDKLGFSDEHMQSIEHLLHQPNGMIIIAGPTGSGKTTTAYSMLHHINKPEIKLMTVENPVEYAITGTSQVQVNYKTGLTFATAIRALLRLDPDIIYVGDLRDRETTALTSEAALTGHLVVTTLHANDSAGVLQRMVDKDIGAEPYVVGATLIGVVVQRLARRICAQCKEEVQIDPNEPRLRLLGITADDLEGHVLYRGRGCDACRNTGYKGRIGLYELLVIDNELAAMISDNIAITEVIKTAELKGFKPMREDAKQKVLRGITTIEEASRLLVI